MPMPCPRSCASCIMRRAPFRVASSFPCHASRRTRAGGGEPSIPRAPVSDTTSSISARCDAADPKRPWRTVEPAAQAQRERERRERTDPSGEQRPAIGEIAPGMIIEDVCRGQDRVEVHDMDMAPGDCLEMGLVACRVGDGRAECLVRGAALLAQHGGKAHHDRGDRLREIATYGDVPRRRGDGMARRLRDQMATSERGGDSCDTRAGGELRLVGAQ